jgi:hypothetical protein
MRYAYWAYWELDNAGPSLVGGEVVEEVEEVEPLVELAAAAFFGLGGGWLGAGLAVDAATAGRARPRLP